MMEQPVKSQRQVAQRTKLGYNQIMNGRETQKAIQEAYAKWSEKVEFTSETGASDKDESEIMAQISTILKGNKPQSEQCALFLEHGGYSTETYSSKR